MLSMTVLKEANMGQYRILLVDLNPNPISCPNDRCERLPKLLKASLPDEVHIQIITSFPSKDVSRPPDLILLRPSLIKPLQETIGLLKKQWSQANILCLFCIGWEGTSEIFRAMQNGLDDYFTCPYKEIDFFPRIHRLVLLSISTFHSYQAKAIKERLHLESLGSLVGESKCFLRIVEKIPLFANVDAPLLILGETGVGKEIFARSIHYQSTRQDRPFIPANCGALPDHLFENELFGHAKGAYTDASSDENGLIAEAEGGTLFLDEVGTLSPSAQTKLLRFLQDRKYRRLGCPKNIDADVRIIAATNSDLKKELKEKTSTFREDLYHRLHVLSVEVPPLRERMDDIPLLATHFLVRYGIHHQKEHLRLSQEALQKLMSYSWPGNIRELEGVIQRALLLSSKPTIGADEIDIPLPYEGCVFEKEPSIGSKAQIIRQLEKCHLINLMEAHQGNISQAARASGKKRQSLQRLLKKYGMNGQDFKS